MGYKIISKKELCPNQFEIQIEAPYVVKNAKAGQFIIFRAEENGERVPLTIADVDKEKGILSQKDNTNDPDILSMVKEYLKQKYNKPGEAYLGLLHRLDRMTSGVMVFAKTSKAAARLSKDIAEGRFYKSYLAVVEGTFKDYNEQTLVNYLEKDEKKCDESFAHRGRLSENFFQ